MPAAQRALARIAKGGGQIWGWFKFNWLMPVTDSKPRKPSKTAAELEAAIKLELKEVNRCPPNIAVTVFPDGESWKVIFLQDVPIEG
jgi:hypothetical protein